MSNQEEQANELEALQAIYMEQFIAGSSNTFEIALKPTTDDSEKCWVSVHLKVQWPASYPLESGPKVDFTNVVGLDSKQVEELRRAADATAEENAGAPAIYAVAERVREWLIEHNEQPSDGSAFAEMMKRQRQKEKDGAGGAAAGAGAPSTVYDRENDPSIKRKVVYTEEMDEAVRRKKYGTPVTREAFLAWREKFDAEMAQKAADDAAKGIEPDIFVVTVAKGRLTGKQMFERDASLATSDVALAAAAERAAAAAKAGAAGGAAGGAGEGDAAIDASVFLAGDDDDLDDLDDDDDDEYEPSDGDEDDEDFDDDEDEDDE